MKSSLNKKTRYITNSNSGSDFIGLMPKGFMFLIQDSIKNAIEAGNFPKIITELQQSRISNQLKQEFFEHLFFQSPFYLK